MKKLLFLSIIILFAHLFVPAQRFNKIYKYFEYQDYTASLELDSSIIIASNRSTMDGNKSILLMKIDKDSGDTILTRRYFFDGMYFYTSIFLIKSDENSFYVIGYAYDGSKSNNDDYTFRDTIIYSKQKIITSEKSRRNYTYFFKVNTNLDTIFSKKYNDKYFSSCFEKDSTLLLGGQTYLDSLHRKSYLCEIKKADGELLKDTIIPTDTSFSNPIIQGISKSKKGDYIFCATTFERGILFRMDTAWNIEWLRYYTQPHSLYTLIEDNDTNIIVGGMAFQMYENNDPIQGEALYKCALWKFNGQGDFIWHKRVGDTGGRADSYSYTGFVSLFPYKNNSYLAFGQTDTTYYHSPRGYLYQFDNNGNEITHRYFMVDFNDSYLSVTSINKKEDNGFLLTGYALGVYSHGHWNSAYWYYNVPFIISIDSLFKDNWGSWDTITHFEISYKRFRDNKILKKGDTLCYGDKVVMQFKSVTSIDSMLLNFDIYWNDNYISACHNGAPLYSDSFKVASYSLVPNQVYSFITPPVNPPCNEGQGYYYQYQLGAINYYKYGSFYRLGYDSATHLGGMFMYFNIDTCVVGVPELPIEKAGIKLYPNPSTSYITLQSEQVMNGNISIFNNLGLVVKEEEIKQENKKTIDIRTLPAGLYLLRYKEQTLRFSVVK